jgi:hypothetical protein
MEPEQQSNASVTTNPAFSVTPLSKYLAMFLFILLPFIAGYIGYVYAPEKVSETERLVVIKETPKEENDRSFPATREIIETIPNGNYLEEANYVFDNGFYTVSFIRPISFSKVEQFDDPNDIDGTLSFMNYYYGQNEDGTINPLLDIHIHLSSYCRLALCEKKATDVITLPDGNEWELLGETEYCDVGHCSGDAFTYRRTIGQYVIYLGSESSLHDSEIVGDNIMLPTLKTFKFELSNR